MRLRSGGSNEPRGYWTTTLVRSPGPSLVVEWRLVTADVTSRGSLHSRLRLDWPRSRATIRTSRGHLHSSGDHVCCGASSTWLGRRSKRHTAWRGSRGHSSYLGRKAFWVIWRWPSRARTARSRFTRTHSLTHVISPIRVGKG